MPSLNPQLHGREYWMGLEQLARSPEMEARFAQEFAGYDPQEMQAGFPGAGHKEASESGPEAFDFAQAGGHGVSGVSRRTFMKLMSAAMALAGLTATGCRRWPEDEIRPYAHRPEGFKPGEPRHYATMMEIAGVATGLLVKSFDGRPIKIEGNPQHPGSYGATDVWAQAMLLDLYDPQRSRSPVERVQGVSRRRTWEDFTSWARPVLAQARADGGKKLAILAEMSLSRTAQRLRTALKKMCPDFTWCGWDAIHDDAALRGSQAAFGKARRALYHLDQARVVASFQDDLLGMHPARVTHARDWAATRRSADEAAGTMSRWYAVEANLSLTGAAADVRLPLSPVRSAQVLRWVAGELGVIGGQEKPQLSPTLTARAEALVRDLKAAGSRALVTVGPSLSAEDHALAHAINQKLGAFGTTVTFINERRHASLTQEMANLVKLLQAGQIDTLVILGGNPAYTAPVELKLSELLAKVPHAIHLAPEVNETSSLCQWHVNQAHSLECWGDGYAWDGTLTVQQPLILPLFDGKSVAEMLAVVVDSPVTAGMDLVKETWRSAPLAKTGGGEALEKAWQQVLHDGFLAASAWPAEDVSAPIKAPGQPKLPAPGGMDQGGVPVVEVLFVADNAMYDGRFANNGWLEEMPDPITKLVWDNAALVSKEDADAWGVVHGQMIQLEAQGRAAGEVNPLEIPVFIQPGIAPGTVVLPLGYGRQVCGSIGVGVGFDTYQLRVGGTYHLPNVKLTKVARHYKLVTTQEHFLIDAVGMAGVKERVGEKHHSGLLVREAELAEYRQDRELFHRNEEGGLSLALYDKPNQYTEPHAWGMAVDMTACTGCHACVIACQAENNVPIVGKVEVDRNREMHWLRIDRYFKGTVDDPETVFMPMACAHCENAPCEQVCPVAATTHDTEGLNVMVYNRCIGTRYCSNNCPFKVRHFNYYDWQVRDPRLPGNDTPPYLNIPDQQQQEIDPVKRMIFNPQVTVRMRGVMEKCTYCTQRIQAAKIDAQVGFAQGTRASDLVQEGEVLTACQQVCPTQAIVFGNLNDPQSKVARLHRSQRAYATLGELNLHQRTLTLAKVTNPPAGA